MIRYTIGPEEIWIGKEHFKRGVWRKAGKQLRDQALLPGRVKAYGFEEQRGKD